MVGSGNDCYNRVWYARFPPATEGEIVGTVGKFFDPPDHCHPSLVLANREFMVGVTMVVTGRVYKLKTMQQH